MCTLTYIPLGQDSFLWTHNRDESPKRKAEEIAKNGTIVYPKEPISGGTWVCVSKQNKIVSLLNGAYTQQKYELSTVRSRGLVVLDFFEYKEAQDFFDTYNLEGIEPFTMIIHDNGKMWDFRWDKTQKYLNKLDFNQPYIWSSSMLYTAEIKQKREQWFDQYLNEKEEKTKANILNFHKYGGVGDIANDLLIDRAYLQTVSITSISKNKDEIELEYINLLENSSLVESLKMNN